MSSLNVIDGTVVDLLIARNARKCLPEARTIKNKIIYVSVLGVFAAPFA